MGSYERAERRRQKRGQAKAGRKVQGAQSSDLEPTRNVAAMLSREMRARSVELAGYAVDIFGVDDLRGRGGDFVGALEGWESRVADLRVMARDFAELVEWLDNGDVCEPLRRAQPIIRQLRSGE